MSKLSQNTILWLLILSVLSSSLGAPLHKRSCEMPTMQDEFSFYVPPKACFEHAHQDHSDAPRAINPCCKFSSIFLKADSWDATTYHLNLELDLIADVFNSASDKKSYTLSAHIQKTTPYSNHSPPLEGKQIIILKQSFLL